MTPYPARDVTPEIRIDPCRIYVVVEKTGMHWEAVYSFESRSCAESYVRSHETPERCRVFECRERRKT